jgi:hypothetical protein
MDQPLTSLLLPLSPPLDPEVPDTHNQQQGLAAKQEEEEASWTDVLCLCVCHG